MSPSLSVLLDIAARSAIVSVICLAFYGMMRNRSASDRHILLTATQLALLALLPAFFLAPKWTPFGWERHIVTAAGSMAGTGLAANPVDLATTLWIAGCSLILLRGLFCLARVLRVRAGSVPLADEGLRARIAKFLNGRRVTVLEGSKGLPPMTWGWLRPVVLIPSSASEWPESQLESVLSHELAHVERADWVIQVLAGVICAVYWFNPLVWYMAWRLRAESEQAADDRVLAQGCRPEEYALHLLGVARSVRQGRKMAAVLMAGESPIGQRLMSILNEKKPRSGLGRVANVMMIGSGCAIACGIAAAAPKQIMEVTPIPVPVAQFEQATPIPAPFPASPRGPGPALEAKVSVSKPKARPSFVHRYESKPVVMFHRQRETVHHLLKTVAKSNGLVAANCPPVKHPALVAVKIVIPPKDFAIPRLDDETKKAIAKANKVAEEALKKVPSQVVASVKIPDVNVSVPEIHVDTPAIEVSSEYVHVKLPSVDVHVPKLHVHMKGPTVKGPNDNSPDNADDPSAASQGGKPTTQNPDIRK